MAKVCLTPGDPLGVGPEITVKFLTRHLQNYPETTFTVIGSYSALEKAASQLGCVLPVSDQVCYLDIADATPGAISYTAIEKAVDLIVEKKADVLVTGPIAKHHLKEAGLLASGHTEILEALAQKHFPKQNPKAEMLFVHDNFRLLLLTRHIPLADVSDFLTQDTCKAALETLIFFLKTQVGVVKPRIAVLGVNPHAGEIGGNEEAQVLIPVMNQLNKAGIADLEGPFAADGFFRGFNATEPGYDAIVATYHDQGLIPFKLLAGHQAVNVTIGLPFLRTSVGHGTAFDIAGKGIADETGLVAAVKTALKLIP